MGQPYGWSYRSECSPRYPSESCHRPRWLKDVRSDPEDEKRHQHRHPPSPEDVANYGRCATDMRRTPAAAAAA